MTEAPSNIDVAIGYLYESLDDDDYLMGFLRSIAKEYDSCNVGVGWTHWSSDKRFFVTSDSKKDIQSEYIKNMEHDPWMIEALARPNLPIVVTGSELVKPYEYRDTDFYHKIIKPGGIEYLLCAAQINEQQASWLAINRAEDQFDFVAKDKSSVERFAKHLFRFIRFHQRDLLIKEYLPENLVSAVVSKKSIEWMSDSFKDFVKNSGVLFASGNKLSLKNQRLEERLNKEIRHICERKLSGVDTVDIVIPSVDGEIVLHLYPKARMTADLFRRYSVLLVISDKRNPNRTIEREMKEKYGCTNAEFEVARLVEKGCSLSEIAETRLVSRETVRSQIKRVFNKVGVSSQSKLAVWMRSLSENKQINE